MAKPTDLVQGKVDVLVLGTPALQPVHGGGIAQRVRQVSTHVFQVNQGALYPALDRLEQQGSIGAKYYSLTPDGGQYLRQERAPWKRLSLAFDLVLENA